MKNFKGIYEFILKLFSEIKKNWICYYLKKIFFCNETNVTEKNRIRNKKYPEVSLFSMYKSKVVQFSHASYGIGIQMQPFTVDKTWKVPFWNK